LTKPLGLEALKVAMTQALALRKQGGDSPL